MGLGSGTGWTVNGKLVFSALDKGRMREEVVWGRWKGRVGRCEGEQVACVGWLGIGMEGGWKR